VLSAELREFARSPGAYLDASGTDIVETDRYFAAIVAGGKYVNVFRPRFAVEDAADVLAEVRELAPSAIGSWQTDSRELAEARQPVRILGHAVRERFQCDVAAEPCIPGPVHLAHPARAEQAHDRVRTELGSRSEGHARDYTACSGRGDVGATVEPFEYRPRLGE